MTESTKLVTEQNTSLMITQLANEDKMISPQNIVHFSKDDNEPHDDDKLADLYNDDAAGDTQPNKASQYRLNVEHNMMDAQNNNNNEQPQPQVQNEEKKVEIDEQDEELDEYDKARPERKKLLKLNLLKKLGELAHMGIPLTQNYNMNSDYKLMKEEYTIHQMTREKLHSVNFWNETCLTGIELLEKFNEDNNYFGLRLDGWHDRVNVKSDAMHEAFEELYDKYNTTGKGIAPELKLMGILGMSAVQTHMSNKKVLESESLEDKQNKDPNYINNLKQQARGEVDTTSEKMRQHQKERTAEEYKKAAKDIEEYGKYRKLVNEAEADFNNLEDHRNPQPEINDTPQKHMVMPTMPHSLRMDTGRDDRPYRPNMSKDEFDKIRNDDINAQRERLAKEFEQRQEQMKSSYSHKSKHRPSKNNDHETNNDDNSSIVVINPNIDEISNGITIINNDKREKKARRNKNSNQTAIKVDI